MRKGTKKFKENGKMYRFDFSHFKFKFDSFVNNNKTTKSKVEKDLADSLDVSESAIHNWYFMKNGPSDINMIESLSNFFDCEYMCFLTEVKEEKEEKEDKELREYSNLQLNSIKKIYDLIIEFLEEFRNTGGFTTTLWYEFSRRGYEDIEGELYDYVERKIQRINLVIKQVYFYLHGLSLYKQIIKYCENDLYDTFDGKLEYAYRFEAIPEGNPTTDEDYFKALNKINDIIKDII